MRGIYDSAEGSARRAPASPGSTEGPSAGPDQYGHLFGGFDFNQDAANRDPSRSAKYGFASAAGPVALTDQRWQGLTPNAREDMASFFNEHVRPRLEAEGYTIHQVVGDKIEITTREGRHWVDWVENAGSTDPDKPPRLAWQAQTASGDWLHDGPGGGLEIDPLPEDQQPPPGGTPPPTGPPEQQGIAEEAYYELADDEDRRLSAMGRRRGRLL